ncbi:MAG: MFS transporter [Coraliomargarita sp.]|nr:MFS transporter [Coraliomargarita sp.]
MDSENKDTASNETLKATEAEGAPNDSDETKKDASRSEVAIYALGNVESSVADRFPEILQNILIVAAHLNPLLVGLVMAVRTLWDAVMDPIIAHISDNTKSRWGRRRPYILVGGVSRCLFLLPFIFFIPINYSVVSNELMEAQKNVNENIAAIESKQSTLESAFIQLPDASPEMKARIIDVLEGRPPKSWITNLVEFFSPTEELDSIAALGKSVAQIETYLPLLEADLAEREKELNVHLDTLAHYDSEGVDTSNKEYQKAAGLANYAEESIDVAVELIEKAKRILPRGHAAQFAAEYLLVTHNHRSDSEITTLTSAQELADIRLEQLGIEPIPLFSTQTEPVPELEASPESPESFGEKIGAALSQAGDAFIGLFKFEGLHKGASAFLDPANLNQRTLVLYLLVAYIIFATLTTVNGAPYYALGIELSPSYEGRTQVVVYRSILNKAAGIISPWVPVFCFSLFFANAFDGLFWIAVIVCCIGIPSTTLMFFKTRERTEVTVKKAGERPNIFRSMWEIGSEKDFLRILFLFVFIGLVNGLFQQIGFFLNVYWITGSALSGATLGAKVALVAWGIGLISLPVIKWACDKFEKHRVLQFAIVWMSIGTALKWWLMNPEHPEYQFILPFFFSVGISSVYTVLPAMMADVTDLDELRYGVRREGMFGAVMGFLMKTLGTITPIAAGIVLVISDFDAGLEYQQAPQTITNMRIMYSIVPAIMLLGALYAVRKYPLTRARVADIKAQLHARHEAEGAEAKA